MILPFLRNWGCMVLAFFSIGDAWFTHFFLAFVSFFLFFRSWQNHGSPISSWLEKHGSPFSFELEKLTLPFLDPLRLLMLRSWRKHDSPFASKLEMHGSPFSSCLRSTKSMVLLFFIIGDAWFTLFFSAFVRFPFFLKLLKTWFSLTLILLIKEAWYDWYVLNLEMCK